MADYAAPSNRNRLADFPALCAHPTQSRRRAHSSKSKVPVTILTGYLGAGKTTLLRHILKAHRSKKVAIILNEFGNSADIDGNLIAEGGGSQSASVLMISNGCMCCLARKASVDAINSMLDNEQTFDHIILEATGLADPGNILGLIQDHQGLGKRLFVNKIITVVDAKNIHRSLREPVYLDTHRQDIGNPEAARVQLKYADVIILNKIDLVSPHEVEEAKTEVAIVNPDATMHVTTYSDVPQVMTAMGTSRRTSVIELPSTTSNTSSTHLDPQMTTISVPLPILSPDQAIRFESWIRSMLWDTVFSDTIHQHYRLPSTQTSSLQIHRIKGRLSLSDGSSRTMQGVREGFEITDHPSSMTVIGLNSRNKEGNGNDMANKSRPARRRSVSDLNKRNYSRSVGSIEKPVYQRSISPFSGKKSRSKSYERPQVKQSGANSLPGKIVLIGRGLVKEQFQRSMGAHVLSVA